jgi:quaternary ammonium compound-resistance protein SugE
MAWIHLLIAGLLEVVWAVGLKYAHGFTKMYPSIITVAGMIFSFYYLSLATKYLPLGTAYAVWTGIGAIGTVIMGIVLFDESRNTIRLLFLGLIFVGIIGLKFTSKS